MIRARLIADHIDASLEGEFGFRSRDRDCGPAYRCGIVREYISVYGRGKAPGHISHVQTVVVGQAGRVRYLVRDAGVMRALPL